MALYCPSYSLLWTMRMMLLLIICLQHVLACCLGWNAAHQRSSLGFVASTTRHRQRSTRLFDVPYNDGFSGSGSSGNNKKKKENMQNHKMQNSMDIVRSLQEAFYNSVTLASTPHVTFRGDLIENLPIWHVSWQEVPGRTNILHVQDGIYTNMFEQILHQPQHTWYIGHLYVPPTQHLGLSRSNTNIKSSSLRNPKHQLRAWNDPLSSNSDEEESTESDESSSSCADVLGTLLRITDYRRLVDGRLILLVQAMERFVVTHVQQHVPYGMATVQLLPDLEEVDDDYYAQRNKVDNSCWVQYRTEWDVAPARALALQESFQKWHIYEYENTLLPLPLLSSSRSSSKTLSQPYILEESDLVASALVTVLPFAPYSSTINVAHLAAESIDLHTSLDNDDDGDDATTFATDIQDDLIACTSPTTPTLEQRLMDMGILLNETTITSSLSSSSSSHINIDPSILKMSSNELEFRLWWAINDFLKTSRTPVSPILLGLLPPLSTWDVYMDQYGSVDDIVIMKNYDTNENNDSNSKSSSSPSPAFVLHRIAHAIQEQTKLEHKYVAVDELYPALRRQKRLSYAAAFLLENPLNQDAITAFRKVLLQIPSTRQRLALVYQMLQTECCWGTFQ